MAQTTVKFRHSLIKYLALIISFMVICQLPLALLPEDRFVLADRMDSNLETEADRLAKLSNELHKLSLASPIVAVYFQPRGSNLLQPLLEINPDEPHIPASLAKIMTLYTAKHFIDSQKLDINSSYEIKAADLAGLAENNVAVCGFQVGERLSLYDLLAGCLVASGGDAVNALISSLGLKQAEFIAQMNELSEVAGWDLQFSDPIGLNYPGQSVTARGMALLLSSCLADPVLRDVLHLKYYSIDSGERQIDLRHTIYLYAETIGIDCDLIQGGKTGWVGTGGYNLISFQDTVEGQLIIVNMGAEGAGMHLVDHLDIITTATHYLDLINAQGRDIAAIEAMVQAIRNPASDRDGKTQPSSEEDEAEQAGEAEQTDNVGQADSTEYEAGQYSSRSSDSAETRATERSSETRIENSQTKENSQTSAEQKLPRLNSMEFVEEEDSLLGIAIFIGLAAIVLILLSIIFIRQKRRS
ncbi:MAG: serine hydrolase [Eubacteriales bacterium]|nr:serine hydrolase [Eubacteriales bacterium]